MALESEEQPKTPEAPTVERAPESPKPPETAAELDELGSAWEALIGDEATRAKQEIAGSFDSTPERIGVEPGEAARVADETGITAERAQAEADLDAAAEAAKSEIAAEAGDKSAEEQETQAELDAALDELKNLDVEATAQEFFADYYKRGKTDPEGARQYQTEFLAKMDRLKESAAQRSAKLREELKDAELEAGSSLMGIVEQKLKEEGASFNSKWEEINKRYEELVAEARKTGR